MATEVVDVHSVGEVGNTYSPRQLLGNLKTSEDFADVVFYVPFVHQLVRGRQHTQQITDIFSHALMQILGEHPLVITDLEQKVFEAMPPILLPSDQKVLERTIHITPKQAWDALGEQLQTSLGVDKPTQRVCIFRMYEEEVFCPLKAFADRRVKVWYCNLYGNKETYYFAKGVDETGREIMRLYYAPPIKEVVALGQHLLGLLQESESDEAAYTQFTKESQGDGDLQSRLLALQKNDKLQKALAASPLDESQLSAKQRADIKEMIKMYYQIYGDQTEK
jgi:hypothetical protein